VAPSNPFSRAANPTTWNLFTNPAFRGWNPPADRLAGRLAEESPPGDRCLAARQEGSPADLSRRRDRRLVEGQCHDRRGPCGRRVDLMFKEEGTGGRVWPFRALPHLDGHRGRSGGPAQPGPANLQAHPGAALYPGITGRSTPSATSSGPWTGLSAPNPGGKDRAGECRPAERDSGSAARRLAAMGEDAPGISSAPTIGQPRSDPLLLADPYQLSPNSTSPSSSTSTRAGSSPSSDRTSPSACSATSISAT